MQIIVTSRNFEVTPAIRTQVENELNAAIANKAMKVTTIRVFSELIKNTFKVGIQINAKGRDFESSAEDFDMYKALAAAVDKVESQMAKTTEKIQEHQASPLRDAEPKAGNAE